MNLIQLNTINANLDKLERDGTLKGKNIFLFGHCPLTDDMADLIIARGYEIRGLLDNNSLKWGMAYKGIPVLRPAEIMQYENAVVLINVRFYETMRSQLHDYGFEGPVYRMLDYNSFAEYSLSDETLARKKERLDHGFEIIDEMDKRNGKAFYIFCPFPALGDVYFTMSYLNDFLWKRGAAKDDACIVMSFPTGVEVVRLFDKNMRTEVLPQDDLEAAMQAALFSKDNRFFIAHQDRPYVVRLQRMLHSKLIPLDMIYRCGIFGLTKDTQPEVPMNWEKYHNIAHIHQGEAVIISPYAKSVPTMDEEFWSQIIVEIKSMGKQLFTNVAGNEKPLPGTEPIRVQLNEKKSLLEKAGTFIGVRSGLCDIIKSVNCKKIALYPDYYYMGTRWKAIDMYSIDSFTNIEVTGDVDIKDTIINELN